MRVLLTAALLLAASLTASAEIFAMPFASLKFGDGTSIFDLEFVADGKKFTGGGAAIRMDRSVLGYEASFGYVLGYHERDNSIWTPGSFLIDLTRSAALLLRF